MSHLPACLSSQDSSLRSARKTLVDRSSRHPPGTEPEETLSAEPSPGPAVAMGALRDISAWMVGCKLLMCRGRRFVGNPRSSCLPSSQDSYPNSPSTAPQLAAPRRNVEFRTSDSSDWCPLLGYGGRRGPRRRFFTRQAGGRVLSSKQIQLFRRAHHARTALQLSAFRIFLPKLRLGRCRGPTVLAGRVGTCCRMWVVRGPTLRATRNQSATPARPPIPERRPIGRAFSEACVDLLSATPAM